MSGDVVTFFIATIIVGILIFIAVLLTGKRNHHFNVEDYQIRFLKIENTLNKENYLSFANVITEADKLLDKALIEMGIPGKTMGERLKKSGTKFSNLNAVWRAHKVRNAIAHEAGFEVSFQQAKNALEIYKQALKDLGAI